MATRSRSRKKASDEKFFPIRVRIQVPSEGFGSDIENIFAWLDENAGRGCWGWNADQVLSRDMRDAVSLYLLDVELVSPLLQRFELKLAVADAGLCGEGSFKRRVPVEAITQSPETTISREPKRYPVEKKNENYLGWANWRGYSRT